MKAIAIVMVVGILALGLIGVVYGISTYNSAAKLKNTYEMKVKSNSGEFDNMWKQISQVTQIADSKKEAFKEVFNGYATARTPEGAGKVMFWVKENAPNLDLSVYDKAQNIIVASRNGWTARQTELVDIAREYNQNLVTFPKNVFLGMFGFQKIDPKVITSSRTEKAFEDGKDDDVSLTGQKK
jgi:LemA protein